MRKFKLKSGLVSVFLPGTGRVTSIDVLSGDQYAAFVPALLEELPLSGPVPLEPPREESPAVPPPLSGPVLAVTPTPSPESPIPAPSVASPTSVATETPVVSAPLEPNADLSEKAVVDASGVASAAAALEPEAVPEVTPILKPRASGKKRR